MPATPEGFPELEAREVHVWHADLDALCLSSEIYETLAKSIAPDERARAALFHFEKDRARFVATRGVLRALLGKYLK